MKPSLILLITLLVMPLISSLNYTNSTSQLFQNLSNKEYVCNKVFYFLVEKGSNYRKLDFDNLYLDINRTYSISKELIEYSIRTYNESCFPIINKTLPLTVNVEDLKKEKIAESCVYSDDFNISNYNLELYIPTGKIYLDFDCVRANKSKFLFSFYNEGGIFAIKGVRVFPIIILILVILILKYFKSNVIMKDTLRKVSTPYKTFIYTNYI